MWKFINMTNFKILTYTWAGGNKENHTEQARWTISSFRAWTQYLQTWEMTANDYSILEVC